MKKDWFSRFRPKKRTSPKIGSFDPARFEELCAEDTAEAAEWLRRDYAELREEFEETVRRYAEYAARLGERLDEPVDTAAEARELRDAHDRLRMALRRLNAAFSETRDIEEELMDWEDRRGEFGPAHADHPSVRAEILRSELAARREGNRRSVPKGKTRLAWTEPRRGLMNEAETLIAMIRHATAEAECWHDVPRPDQDAAEQIRNVRHLHALLKQLDREAGKRRDRTAFAIRMREH